MVSTSRLGAALVTTLIFSGMVHSGLVQVAEAAQAELATVTVQPSEAANSYGYDAVVEAVRQTVVAAQVSGAVVELPVKVGDTVKPGQVLARIDARSATQGNLASQAQAQAARSALDLATKDVQRQRHLFEKQYISQSAMERAEAQYRATSEQFKAQIAQASITTIQSDFFTLRAPYAGVIAELPIALGDMAMPGKPMVTIYDPAALRITAAIPQTAIGNYLPSQAVRVEFPALPKDRQWLSVAQLQILPTIDVGTHSVQVRANLPAGLNGLVPGMFARVWLPLQNGSGQHFFVPGNAVVRRAEMTGLYVLDSNRHPVLRQVRLGKVQGSMIEVLTGISKGDQVALDPAAAVKEVQ
ncbi:multidrug efflux system membrane fusion protein [Oxalobacteraceae bacterium GrIS 2.11]